MAVSSPTGSATAMAIKVAINVPYTSGRTPKLPCWGAQRVEVRNSPGETSKKNRTVSSKRTTTIPTVVKIDRYAQAVSKTFITRSRASLVRLLRFQASVSDLVPPASTATENPPKPRDQKDGAGSWASPHMLQADPFWHKRLLRLLECRLQVATLRLALLGEHRAGGAVLVLGPRLLRQAAGQRHVLRGLHEPVEVLLREVEIHERLDRPVVLQRVGAHVDEQWAGEQILTGANGLLAGLDAVHRERLERVEVVLVVGVTEVAERVFVAGDALDEHVVVLTSLVVGTIRFLFVPNDDLVKKLVRARLGAGTVEAQLPVGPIGAYLAPTGNLAFRGRLPHRLELLGRDVRRPIVALFVDDDRDAVEGDWDLDELDPVLLADWHLLGHVYRPGSVRDLGVALAESLEPVAGSRAADLDARLRVLFPEQLRGCLGDRLHGAGAFDVDTAQDLAATLAATSTATAGGQNERQGQNGYHNQQLETRNPTQYLRSLRSIAAPSPRVQGSRPKNTGPSHSTSGTR